MNLGPNSIEWCDSLKYIGITFQAGLKLKVNIDMIKQKFFMASNSVLGDTHSLDEYDPVAAVGVILLACFTICNMCR